MKPLHLLLIAAALGVAALAGTALLGGEDAPVAPPDRGAALPAPERASEPGPSSRTPAAGLPGAGAGDEGAEAIATEGFQQDLARRDDERRAEVLAGIRAEREEKRRQRMAERAAREERWLVQKADRIVGELELPAGAQLVLADILVEELARRRATFEEVKAETDLQAAREAVARTMREVATWKRDALVTHFGEETADRIEKAEYGDPDEQPDDLFGELPIRSDVER